MDEKYNILLVDDEEDNLSLLYRTLRGSYNLDRSTSPLKALEMMDEKDYQLVISDHKMPEMDGVMGNNLLKRFNLVYDSQNSCLYLIPNNLLAHGVF